MVWQGFPASPADRLFVVLARIAGKCLIVLILAGFLSGCGSSRYPSSRSAHAHYPPLSGKTYSAPGTPDDPWGPYIREASSRFKLPERWVRQVMQRESSGQLYQDGSLTTSPVGAMGLMQVMPDTYLLLQQQYGLGDDPYDPHDNIMAGTGYLRQMYDRFGSPGFLAAYNAGPGRLNEFLFNGTPLPGETVAYVAAIAPNLGSEIAPTGPLAAYALASPETGADELNQRVASGTFTPSPSTAPSLILPPPPPIAGTAPAQVADAGAAASDDSADDLNAQSLAHGSTYRPVTAAPVTQVPLDSGEGYTADQSADDLNRRYANANPAARSLPPSYVMQAAATPQASNAYMPVHGAWSIQVGAFSSPSAAETATENARSFAMDSLGSANPDISMTKRPDGVVLYRAKLAGLTQQAASAACARIMSMQRPCIILPSSVGS